MLEDALDVRPLVLYLAVGEAKRCEAGSGMDLVAEAVTGVRGGRAVITVDSG